MTAQLRGDDPANPPAPPAGGRKERDWPVRDGVLELGDLPVERGGVIQIGRASCRERV